MRNPHADDAALAIRRVRGDGFGECRAAGIGVAQCHYVEAARGHAREQNSGFVGLGAGIGEKALLQIPRSDLRDFLRQRHDVFGGVERRSVLQAVDLRAHFAGDFRIAVPHGDRQDAAEEIQVLVAFDVPEMLHLAAVSHQRLLEIVGHRGPQIFFVLGDGFFAARATRERGCRYEMCWRGHGGILCFKVAATYAAI